MVGSLTGAAIQCLGRAMVWLRHKAPDRNARKEQKRWQEDFDFGCALVVVSAARQPKITLH